MKLAAGLTLDEIIGGVYSAMPVSLLPACDRRPLFAEQVRSALPPDEELTEHVHVSCCSDGGQPAPQHPADQRIAAGCSPERTIHS